MFDAFLKFLDNHIGTLAGADLLGFLFAGVLIYAIYKGAPILQEYLKNKKQVVDRRKGMNGNGDLEKLEKKVDNDRERNQEEHSELFQEVKNIKTNFGERFDRISEDISELKVMVGRLDERSKKNGKKTD